MDWRELTLQPGDREALESLHTAVLAEKPDAIGQIIGRRLDHPYAADSLSRLPHQSFKIALSKVITRLVEGGEPIILGEVYFRAMTRTVMDMRRDAVSRGYSLAHLVPGVRVNYFRGGSPTLSGPFAKRLVEDIETFLTDKYSSSYPLWLRILITHLHEDVQDKEVTFASIHRDDHLAAVAKRKGNYFGTHYARHPGDGTGGIVQAMILEEIPSNVPVYGLVAPDNPTLRRHFRVNRGDNLNSTLGVALLRDRDSFGESEELLCTVVAGRLCGFQTVHEARYSDAEVDSWAQGTALPECISDRVTVYSAESLNGSSLLPCLRKNFDNDHILTRRTSEAWLFEDRHCAFPLGGRIYWDQNQRFAEMAQGMDVDTRRSR